MTDESLGIEELLPAFQRMSHAYLRCQLDEWGLGEMHNPRILLILRNKFSDRPVPQSKIAEAMGVAPSSAAISIRRMEKAGLVNKVADEHDRRVNRITLTEKGRAFIEDGERAMRSMYRQLIKGFSPTETAQLKSFYIRMIRNMEDMGVRMPANLKRR